MKRVDMLAVLGLILIVVGGAVALYGFLIKQVPSIAWGLLVPAYAFFGLVAGGSSIANSLYTVFAYRGPQGEFEKVVKYGVVFSLASVIASLTLIALDVSAPWRTIWAFISFNVDSRIAWMILIYTAYVIFLIIELAYMILHSRQEAEVGRLKVGEFLLGVLVLATTVLAYTNLAGIFGSTTAVPAWHGAHLAALFIVWAVGLGAAGQSLYMAFLKHADREFQAFATRFYGKMLTLGLLATSVMVLWIIVISGYGPAGEQLEPLLKGEYATHFYVGLVLAGLAAPIVLGIVAILTSNIAPLLAASVLALVGGFIGMYALVVSPQTVTITVFRDWVTLEFSPHADEYVVLLGVLLMWLGLLALGTSLVRTLTRS